MPAINVPAHDNSAMDGYAVALLRSRADATRVWRKSVRHSPGARSRAPSGAGECVRVMTGAVMPRGHGHGGDPGNRRRRKASSVVVPPGQKAKQNVRYAGEDLKVGVPVLQAGQAAAARRARPDRLARHRRSEGEAQAARRVLLHRRRARLDRHAAARKARSTTPTATRCTACSRAWASRSSTWAWCATIPALLEGGLPQGRRERRRGHHHRRRLGRRSRLRQAADGQARRGAVLEDRHAPGPADGLRPHRQRRSSSACPATRSRWW